MTISQAIEDVISTHHRYLQDELPKLQDLLDEVVLTYSLDDENLKIYSQMFEVYRETLCEHAIKEEKDLFPLCIELEENGTIPSVCRGSLVDPMDVMEGEHEAFDLLYQKMQEYLERFSTEVKEDEVLGEFIKRFALLQEDMLIHKMKEENIIFPKVTILESALASPAVFPAY